MSCIRALWPWWHRLCRHDWFDTPFIPFIRTIMKPF